MLSRISHIWLFAAPWTVAHQAPLSMEFSRQEYSSGLTFSTPGDLPSSGIEMAPLVSPALAGRFFININEKPMWLEESQLNWSCNHQSNLDSKRMRFLKIRKTVPYLYACSLKQLLKMVLCVVYLGSEPATCYGHVEKSTGNTSFRRSWWILSSDSLICAKSKSLLKVLVAF